MKSTEVKTGFKPIQALMSENEAIAPMLQRLNLIARFQKTYISTIPAGLSASSRIATVEGTTLIIAAANGAVAASLKQMLPRLLAKFQENKTQEQEVTAIRVVVQPSPADPASQARPGTPASPISPMPDATLNQLAGALDDSPLKATLQKMQKNRERALTGRKKPT